MLLFCHKSNETANYNGLLFRFMVSPYSLLILLSLQHLLVCFFKVKLISTFDTVYLKKCILFCTADATCNKYGANYVSSTPNIGQII